MNPFLVENSTMSKRDFGSARPKSKAAITIDIQHGNRKISDGSVNICAQAESLLDTQAPTKQQKLNILATAESLLEL